MTRSSSDKKNKKKAKANGEGTRQMEASEHEGATGGGGGASSSVTDEGQREGSASTLVMKECWSCRTSLEMMIMTDDNTSESTCMKCNVATYCSK